MMATGYVFVVLTALTSSCCCVQEEATIPQIRQINGQVVDADGSPVADATIRGSLSSSAPEDDTKRLVGNWKTKSDSEGRFSFSVSEDVPVGHRRHFHVHAGSSAHYSDWFYTSNDKLKTEEVTLEPMELTRGVRVRGQLVPPNGLEKPEYPTLNIFVEKSLSPKKRKTSFYRELNCDKDGKFELLVPEDSQFSLTINADNYQPKIVKRKVVVKDVGSSDEVPEVDWGDFKLEPGVSIYGTATLKNGKPAAGVVVAVYQFPKEESERSYEFISAVKTDRDGKYRLPNHGGRCSVLVLKTWRGRIVDDRREMLKTDGKLPIIDSVDIDLNGKSKEFECNLKEADSVVISGTVKDPFGEPVEQLTVVYGWESDYGDLEMDYVNTDRDGKYEVRIAKGRKPDFAAQLL